MLLLGAAGCSEGQFLVTHRRLFQGVGGRGLPCGFSHLSFLLAPPESWGRRPKACGSWVAVHRKQPCPHAATEETRTLEMRGGHPDPGALPSSRVTLATVVHPSESSLCSSGRPCAAGLPGRPPRLPAESASQLNAGRRGCTSLVVRAMPVRETRPVWASTARGADGGAAEAAEKPRAGGRTSTAALEPAR